MQYNEHLPTAFANIANNPAVVILTDAVRLKSIATAAIAAGELYPPAATFAPPQR